MNKDELIKIIRSLRNEKLSTFEILRKYFINLGKNNFDASELAEKNYYTFEDIVNKEIRKYSEKNYYPLYKFVNRNICYVDKNYFKVEELVKAINSISWLDFENLCGNILKKCFNSHNVIVSQKTSDGGIDFSGKLPFLSNKNKKSYLDIEIFGQAKKYSGNISRPEIDKFTGAANNFNLKNSLVPKIFMFLTSSDFSDGAYEMINEYGFIGLNGMQIATLIFQNTNFKNEDPKKILDEYLSFE